MNWECGNGGATVGVPRNGVRIGMLQILKSHAIYDSLKPKDRSHMPELKRGVFMYDKIANLFPLLLLALGLFVLVKLAVRAAAPAKTVPATVVDKYREVVFSKYSGDGKGERFVIVFSAQGRKLSFPVSEFSYGGYAVNETGTLTYRGNRIIAFD